MSAKKIDAAARKIEDRKLRKTITPLAAATPAVPMVLFSERRELEQAALEWCRKNKIKPTPFNIITALSGLGLNLGRAKK